MRKYALDLPENCHNCKSPNIELKHSSEFKGEPNKPHSFIWFCNECEATVGCHKGTFYPLGYMADKKTRQKRRYLHCLFDPLWNSRAMSRSDAYDWLAEQLDISPDACHISMMNSQQLGRAIWICKNQVPTLIKVILRRRKKRNDRPERKSGQRRKTNKPERAGRSQIFI